MASGTQGQSRPRPSTVTSGASVPPLSCMRPPPQTRAAMTATQCAVATARALEAPPLLSHRPHHRPHHGPRTVRQAGHASYCRWTVAMPASRGVVQVMMGLPVYLRSAPPSPALATRPLWKAALRLPWQRLLPNPVAHAPGPAVPLAETIAWMRRQMHFSTSSYATTHTSTMLQHAIAHACTSIPTHVSSGSSAAGSTATLVGVLCPWHYQGLTPAPYVHPCAVVTALTAPQTAA